MAQSAETSARPLHKLIRKGADVISVQESVLYGKFIPSVCTRYIAVPCGWIIFSMLNVLTAGLVALYWAFRIFPRGQMPHHWVFGLQYRCLSTGRVCGFWRMMLYTICQFLRFFVVLYAIVPIVSSLLDIPGVDIIETADVRMALKDAKHRTFDHGVHYTPEVRATKIMAVMLDASLKRNIHNMLIITTREQSPVSPQSICPSLHLFRNESACPHVRGTASTTSTGTYVQTRSSNAQTTTTATTTADNRTATPAKRPLRTPKNSSTQKFPQACRKSEVMMATHLAPVPLCLPVSAWPYDAVSPWSRPPDSHTLSVHSRTCAWMASPCICC